MMARAVIAALAIALAGSALAQTPAPLVTPQAPPPVAPDAPDRNPPPQGMSPTGSCPVPAAGQVTIQREQVMGSGALMIRYNGRDESYGTAVPVYTITTNAEILNSDGTIRAGTWAAFWQGSATTVRGRVCNTRFTIEYVNANDEQITLRIRR